MVIKFHLGQEADNFKKEQDMKIKEQNRANGLKVHIRV
jgi:hypothetical protein